MAVPLLILIAVAALLTVPTAAAFRDGDVPGTVRYAWTLERPESPGGRVYVRKFKTRGGLIRSVRVVVAGKAVPGPPEIVVLECLRARRATLAQKSWLWDGRNVYVSLLLQPGSCPAAARLIKASVILTTVGT